MPPLRAVLLDAGGTLIHPDRDFILDRLTAEGLDADHAAWTDACRDATAAVGDILRSDDPGTDETRARLWFATLLARLGLPEHGMATVGAAIRARHEAGRLWVWTEPGTRELLESLREAGLRLAVISNADGRVADFLETAGLADLFEFVLDSTAVGIEKPDRRIFDLACQRLELPPDEVVYVGDTFEVDVVGARRAGIRAVLLADSPRDGVDCITGIHELPGALGLIAAGDAGSVVDPGDAVDTTR
jgi:putative hydrolase of the HAD superfamily